MRQARRDAAAIRNGVTANRERIIHAGLLLLLSLGGRSDRRERKKRGCQCDLEFHLPLHGLAKALTYFEPDLRGVLKRGGFLTRDPRVVERKKYGRAKARRSFQFSKR